MYFCKNKLKNMKLKFSIRYRTAWGESMHVVVGYYRQDGTVRRQNLTMQTEDGELWTLETAALTSRQHPLSHLIYKMESLLRFPRRHVLRCKDRHSLIKV